MIRQIKKVTSLLLCNFWGINEWRYSKNKSKKTQFLITAFGIGFVALLYMLYIAFMTIGYAKVGLTDIIPAYMLSMTSIIILFFTVYKAGSVLFEMKSYDILISMPLSPAAIIVGRFLTMYVTNMLLSLLTFVPVTIIYAIYIKPAFCFYIMLLLAIFLTPLLPMTIATAVGALIIAISSRTKHKTMMHILLSFVLIIGILVGSMFSGNMTDAQMEEMLLNLSVMLTQQLKRIYPPSILFINAFVNNSFLWYTLFAGISIGAFALFVWIIQKNYIAICSLLKIKETKRNYKLRSLRQSSKLKALLLRECKHYFSSSIYVINTMIGYLMMVLISIAVLVAGVDTLETALGLPGIISKVGGFVLAASAAITSITASTISMEGKQYWLLQSLPLSTKDIINSKILLNLVVAAPFYIISEVFIIIAAHSDWVQCMWLLITPLVYIVFSAVSGLALNLRFPNMHWESETAVVKQSLSATLTMFVNLFFYGLPMVILLFVPMVKADMVKGVSLLIVVLLTVVMYIHSCKTDLQAIQ